MEITPDLINEWKLELAQQVQKSRQVAANAHSEHSRSEANMKADFLEGFYSVLTCLQRAANLPIK